jgi:para-aminobenzoate synthetase / 4-amino-4-deoxychorismate lyase
MSSPFSPDPAAGVFETMLVLEGAPVELDRHMARLGASVEELYDSVPPAGARELVLDHARALPLGRLRLTVAPSQAGELSVDAVTAPVAQANVFPGWEGAIELRPFLVPGGLGPHKWADRAGVAAMESEAGEGSVPLLVDAGGQVLEGSRANVFALDGEVLITPRADGRILPGVAPARALAAARSRGRGERGQDLTLERLAAAPEAFLTGSVRGVEPVRSVEQARFQEPGEAACGIAAAIRRQWSGHVTAGAQ